jgi:predicted secreted hydrolase
MTGTPSGRPAVRVRGLAAAVTLAAVVAGCTGGPILANDAVERPSAPATVAPAVALADPQPVAFPRADGPHDRLTEWWYYTGHLRDRATDERFGFEYVIFRAERGHFPVTWASHLAITDETSGRFLYGQRSEVGPQVDVSPMGAADPIGFAFDLRGLDPTRPETYANPSWTMSGQGGEDVLVATLAPAEAAEAGASRGLGLDLRLSATKPPALHDRDGWIDFDGAGGSYYYSRTAMDATGSLLLDGRSVEVDGAAWFDHQWGDFISVGGGGWDWFAVNLDDGTDLTLSLVRDPSGEYPLAYGTLVEPDGTTRHLRRDAFTVEVTHRWVSPLTGVEYPAGWSLILPGDALTIHLEPTVAAQELDTRQSTGVVYWEGSQRVTASRDGRPLDGEAVRRADGYAPAATGARISR